MQPAPAACQGREWDKLLKNSLFIQGLTLNLRIPNLKVRGTANRKRKYHVSHGVKKKIWVYTQRCLCKYIGIYTYILHICKIRYIDIHITSKAKQNNRIKTGLNIFVIGNNNFISTLKIFGGRKLERAWLKTINRTEGCIWWCWWQPFFNIF